MTKNEQRMPGVMRGCPPCKDCGERHTACHDNCPKDMRGEYGYKHWKVDAQTVNDNRRSYAMERNEVYEEEQRRKKWGITHF